MGQNKGIQLRTADHDWHKTSFSAKLNACSHIWTEAPSSTTTTTPNPIQQKCAVCFFLHAVKNSKFTSRESRSLLFFLKKKKNKQTCNRLRSEGKRQKRGEIAKKRRKKKKRKSVSPRCMHFPPMGHEYRLIFMKVWSVVNHKVTFGFTYMNIVMIS